MKKATTLLSALSLVLLLVSCKNNEIDESKPLIKSISFAGISDRDVTLDQSRYTITVEVPSVLPVEGLVAKLDLTRNSEVREGITPKGQLDLTAFCACGIRTGFETGGRLVVSQPQSPNGGRLSTVYSVVLVTPPGCPEPNGDFPVTFTRRTFPNGQDFIYIHLPVKNLYKSTKVNGVFLKNLATGKTQSNLFFELPCINICDNDSVNRLTVPFDLKLGDGLASGQYEVSIRTTCNNTPVAFPRSIDFVR